tara:strand:- start:275 stop:964 length:690 start_codon:yes stop_codon:yes gene_type:complete
LVEGDDDLDVWRLVESVVTPVDILPCGGKDKVLELYRRRAEFSDAAVAYIVDRDMWLFTDPPRWIPDVMLTDGYSIENDVLSFRAVEKLLDKESKKYFDKLINIASDFFAFEVSMRLRNRPVAGVIRRLHDVLAQDGVTPSESHRRAIGYEEPPGFLLDIIRNGSGKYLRGHVLADCYVRAASANTFRQRYGRKQLFEISVMFDDEGTGMSRLRAQLRLQLANYGVALS